MTKGINIISVGSATPIGWNAGTTFFSQLSGFSRFRMWREKENPYSEEVKVSSAEYLIDELEGADRIDALLTDCIKQSLEELKGESLDIERFSIFVGLPGLRPGLTEQLATVIKSRVEKFIANYLYIFCKKVSATIECTCIPKDNVSGLLALKACQDEIKDDRSELCLAIAVDSFISANTLQWLKATDQVPNETSKWGIVPGEASASVLMASESLQQSLKMKSLGTLFDVVEGIETKTTDSGVTCLGEILTDLVNTLFLDKSLQHSQVDKTYIDLDGDRARNAEFGFALRALGNRIKKPDDFISTISTMGHLGAAYGLILVNLAIIGGLRGYVKGQNSLIITGNKTGERVVALVKTKVEENKYQG